MDAVANFSGPFWVERPKQEVGGVDLLGLRQPGLEMADRLLPGITNFTTQVRYYTVIAWIYARAEEAGKLRLLESAFVQAVRWHEHTGQIPVRGMVGTGSVPEGSEEDARLPLEGSEGRLVSVMDAPFFGPSAKTLGVAGETGGRSGFEAIARELADTVAVDPEALQAISTSGMPRGLLQPISCLCPCESAQGRERELLEELLFRHDRRRTESPALENGVDGPRRRTLALLLDALEPTSDPERFFIERFLETLLRQNDYTPPEALAGEGEGIGLMALRWCFRYGLEIAWSAFGRTIGRYTFGTSRLGPVVAWMTENEAGRDRWRPAADVPIGDLVRELGSDPGVEMAGISEATTRLTEGAWAAASVTASALLALLAYRVRQLPSLQSRYRDFLNLGFPWWVPMSELGQRFNEEMTVREWMHLIFDRYVVGQHLLTASRKWADDKDGFLFHPSETGYRLTPAGESGWSPDPGRTKIPAAMSLLRGIQLVEVRPSSHGDIWRTSAAGQHTIERVLAAPGD